MNPVVENNLIGDQFFLTRQSANLMEDFAREIDKGSSLFLLYGVNAVGKSRVLHELAERGIEKHKFCWINFDSNETESATTNESSGSEPDRFVNEIKELMEAADESDVILADRFELATNKAKHQLFQSWATDGVDKNINLVIATTTTSFNDVKQLAQQYKIKIKSFQLMPCSMAEVEAFLGFHLFPASPLGSLAIPSEIKKQLRRCNGVLGKVIEVANQQGEHISIKPDTESESKNYAVFVTGLLFFILLVTGIIYQYWQPNVIKENALQAPSDKTITIISDNEEVVSINQLDPDPIDYSDEITQPAGISEIKDQQQQSIVIPDLEKHIADNNAPNVNLQIESEALNDAVEIASNSASEASLTVDTNRPISRYQRDLDNSTEWVKSQDKNRGTIQIMTISVKSFNEGAYHRYLEKLESKNIDVSKIRVYQTSVNDSMALGVIYGDYESRREASKNINQLPDVLKVKGPIPRSIGGIWDEINNK